MIILDLVMSVCHVGSPISSLYSKQGEHFTNIKWEEFKILSKQSINTLQVSELIFNMWNEAISLMTAMNNNNVET